MKKILKKAFKNVLKIFFIFPIKKNRIFFMSFNGKKIGFDSKAFLDWLNENNHTKDFEICWGVFSKKVADELSKSSGYNIKFIKLKSIKGIYYMITSGILIYNINPPSYIPFRKKQVLVNTWHSISYKKCGKYVAGYDKEQFNTTTCFLSHSEKYTEWVIKESFEFKGDILNCGVPRNDIFFSDKRYKISEIVRKKLNVENKKILLYAPTFRGNFEISKSFIDVKRIKNALEARFGNQWVILYRLHPMININSIDINEKCINVSQYPDMQELLCASDFLISDYSGSMWDFSLMKKPVFIYADDIDNYENSRGMYLPCEKLPFPLAKNNDELVDNILNFNEEKYIEKLKDYFQYMGCFENGTACEHVYNYILKKTGDK